MAHTNKINFKCYTILTLSSLLTIVAGVSLPDSNSNLKDEEREFVDISVQTINFVNNPTIYNVQLKAFDKELNVNLRRPEMSIFSKNFKFESYTVDQESLKELEKNVYIDPDSMTVLEVVPKTHTFVVRGFIDGIGITLDEMGRHIARRSMTKDGVREGTCTPLLDPDMDSIVTNLTKVNRGFDNEKADNRATMLVWVVHDKYHSDILMTPQEMTRYCVIMFHCLNKIYASLDNPMDLKISGISSFTDEDHNKVVSSQYPKAQDVLPAFASWANNNPNKIGYCHGATLLFGSNFWESEGVYSNTNGIAYVSQSCGNYKYSLARDPGCFWSGYFTMAHELAHILGCSHDFDTSCGSQGYIMDYNRNSPKAYEFSQCSKDAIFERANTPSGSCVLEAYEGPDEDEVFPPGYYWTMAEQCQNRLDWANKPEYTFVSYYPPVDSSRTCLDLSCRCKTSDNTNWIITFPFPLEGTKCDSNNALKTCQKGYCK